MADTQSSPVLVQHPSPPHTLSPEINIAPLSSPPSHTQRIEEQSVISSTMNTSQQQELAEPEPEADTPMPEAPTSEPQIDSAGVEQLQAEGENAHNNEEQAQAPIESTDPVESGTANTTENPPAEAPATATEHTANQPQDGPQTTAEEQPNITQLEPEPPPPPEWVTWEDDLSVPSEEELKEMEGTDAYLSALSVAAHEKKMFREWSDPDQRPVKKIRLSWVIKGVRGTRERPNMARTMHSPAALIDGKYWQIKFYPRGNKNDSISAYIRCTPNKPTPDPDAPESTFAYFEGPPDANVGEGAKPTEVVKTEARPVKEDEKAEPEVQTESNDEKGAEGDMTAELPNPTASQDAPEAQDTVPRATDVDVEMKDESPPPTKENQDFRVPAQLGMIIYNPAEPRTGAYMSSEHQFNQYNDDWGWTSFIGPWNEIHKRQRGQFQALLRDDTLAIDAYIRIFDDPTQALWWHESNDHESFWPSKKLAGYFPMGTPPLYHSPGVAGITSWLLLEPFRKVLQGLDAGKWRHDSQVLPRPLIAGLQYVLHAMRHLIGEQYVHVENPLNTIMESGESYADVMAFWEVLRRSIELEIPHDQAALDALSKIFDVDGKKAKVPSLPVKGVKDFQEGLRMVAIPDELQSSGPDFLPLVLKREIFDRSKREWKMLHDRVALNEEIELPGSSENYTLYGFIVHVGERNSGRFYSILRPNGPGTKWLAFEDGDGNKVFSYTRSKLKDYEGLEGDELMNLKSSRQTAYMAMYIKTSCLKEYLPGGLDEYEAPKWIVKAIDGPGSVDEKEKQKQEEEVNVDVEVYHDEGIVGRTGLLDMFNMKNQSSNGKHFRKYKFPRPTTFYEVRRKLAEDIALDDVQKLRMFIMRNGVLGQYTNAQLDTPRLKRTIGDKVLDTRPLCLWCSTLKTEDDVKLFGYPEKKVVVEEPPVPEATAQAADRSASQAATEDDQVNQADPAVVAFSSTDAPTTTNVLQSSEAIEAPNSPEAAMEDAPAEELAAGNATAPQDEFAQQEASEHDVSGLETSATMEGIVPTSAPDSPEDAQPGTVTQQAPTEATADSAAPTEETENALPVEHGHLVDAVMSDDDQVTPAETGNPASLPSLISIDRPNSDTVVAEAVRAVQQSQSSNEQEMADANEAAIAALIAADAAAMDTLTEVTSTNLVTPPGPTEQAQPNPDTSTLPPPDVDTVVVEQLTPPPPPSQPHPVRNVYGFLQIFHPDKQDFSVYGTFFGKRDEPVKDVLRRCLGYDKEKVFHAWHRQANLDGSTVTDKATFDEIEFTDGVDMVVGEILSDEQIVALRKEGKFSDPFSISRYLRLRERKHPTKALTTSEPVEISDFGGYYYNGPLVKGRAHGQDCTVIYSQGHTYTGPLSMWEKSGPSGKMLYQNGDTYQGEWLGDERHGQGVFIEKRTGNKYVGGFMNGKRWGKGTTHWEMADEEADMCQICYGEDIDALFFDCGHVCACVECAKQCSVCPICRKEVKEVVRMFWA